MRILVVQLADIGDMVLSTPALTALRETFPKAQLDLITSTHAAPVAEAGLINNIITFDRQQFNNSKSLFKPSNLRQIFGLRKGHYDTIIFFHHFTLKLGGLKFWLIARASGAKRRLGLQNGNSWFLTDSIPDGGFGAKHQAQYWLDLVALLGVDASPRPAKIQIDNTFKIPGRHNTVKKSPRVIIHAGSGGYSLARRWDTAKFAAIADRLQEEQQAQIVLVGGPNDDSSVVKKAMQTEPIDLTGKTSLAELAGVIQQADLFIGADSGVMHIAAATGTPLIAIMGPSNPHAWGPWTPTSPSVILRSAVECSPCSYVEHEIGLRDGCPARTCMRLVTAEMVIAAARKLLNNESESPLRESSPPNKIQQPWNRSQILGLPVDGITYEQWLHTIGEWIAAGDRCYHVCTTNPEFTMIAQKDALFRYVLKRADLCVPDGVGLLWAAKHLGTPLPERVTGSDGVPKIAERAAQEGWKLFFLGAAPGIADQAADILREKYPGLQVVGTYSGSPAPEEEDEIVTLVNASGADILLVAYGAPRQDQWIARNIPRLEVSMAMGIGGSFDFIAGIIPRAPVWMQNAGIEWLYRLYLQPSRIGRMMRLPRFVFAVLRRGEN